MYQYLGDLLTKNKAIKGNPITHTRIGDKSLNIYGGKFEIKEEELFYKLYHKKVFVDKKQEFLTEVQLKDKGPILVDVDFRYDTSIETRQHTKDHIFDLINLYLNEINNIANVDGRKFPVFILEKDEPNLLEKITKDGIHLIFGIAMDRVLQIMLRKNVLEKIDDIIEDLPLINEKGDVIDPGICNGYTNWQMYGSRKPAHDAYKLTQYYEIHCEDGVWQFKKKKIKNTCKLLKLISARNASHVEFEMRNQMKEQYNELKKKKYTKKKKTDTSEEDQTSLYNIKFSITNKEKLDKIIKKFIVDNIFPESYHIKETYEFTMMLPEKYYDNYNEWIRVGWALHNMDTIYGFLIWMKFSSQSDKFDYGQVGEFHEKWEDMKDEGLTERSIMYWAKESNEYKYNQIKRNTINYYVERTLQGKTEFDIARVLYHMYKDTFCCSSIKNKFWYEFKNHRWRENERGTSLRYLISTELCNLYTNIIRKYTAEIGDLKSNGIDQDKIEKMEKKTARCADIVLMVKKTNYKNNIMREACELFYNRTFLEELDNNKYLLCFNNGVIDFKNKIFRDGRPEDYLSLCTGIDYIEYDENCPDFTTTQQEIITFMKQLFPDEELNTYMWDHLASTLIGTNENQTFNIYNGKGRNGKSKLVELMSMALGDYKGSVPITLITQKRNTIGSVSPEIAQLKGKRYAVMQEPSKGDKINEGIMKEITGGDPIQGRALYKDTVTYIPQFTLVVCTNTLFDIKSNDEGTWRRIRVNDFKSVFLEDPKPTADEPYQYKVDLKIGNKFKEWVNVFIYMLIKRTYKTNGIVNDCNMVTMKSKEYRKNQDYLAEFVEDMIEQNENKTLKQTEVYEEFQTWYRDNYGKSVPKGKELYAYLNKKLGKKIPRKGWVGYTLIY